MKKSTLLLLLLTFILLGGCRIHIFKKPRKEVRKPVIYLYTEKDQAVNVKLKIDGRLTVSEPFYKEGWNVIAHPDGTVTDPADGKNYPYLYWEVSMKFNCDFKNGFLIPGDSVDFYLHKILPQTGLNAKEQNDFSEYWSPVLKANKFNLVTFPNEVYERKAELIVHPKPEKIIRVFMAFKSVNERTAITPQEFHPVSRSGFTLVEWGGVNLDENEIQF